MQFLQLSVDKLGGKISEKEAFRSCVKSSLFISSNTIQYQ